MIDKMQKKYRVSGSGTLTIDGDTIFISVEDKGDFNLARVLDDMNGCAVQFSFSYEEDYERTHLLLLQRYLQCFRCC